MQTRKYKFIIFSVLLCAIAVMAGCGGNGAVPVASQVASITVTCTSCLFPNGATGVQLAASNQIIMDLTEGQVETLSVTILGLNGQALSGPQFPLTYSTDDPSALSISPGGEVCAGVWDAQFVNCQPGTIPYLSPNDILYPGVQQSPPKTPEIGLTVTTPGAAVTFHVFVHPVIDTIQVIGAYPVGSCLSQGQQMQFTAAAYSSKYPFPVTFDVGFFNWIGTDPTVAVLDSQGRAVSRSSGVDYVTANISLPNATSSQPFPLIVCPVASINLSVLSSTGANGIGLPLNLNAGDKVTLLATALDTNGVSVATAPLKFSSSQPALIPFTSSGPIEGTASASGAGVFSLLATCAPPNCNNAPIGSVYYPNGTSVSPQSLGFGYPVYSNTITGFTSGTSVTNVYVTGRQLPGGHPNHQIQVLNAATLATVNLIDLPYVPNSIVFDPQGETAYIGTNDPTTGATLMQLGAGLTSATTFTGRVVGNPTITTVTGTVLGVSPDSATIIVSDLVNGALFVVSRSLNSAQYYPFSGVTSVSFSPDGSTAILSGASGVFSLSTNQEILQQFVTSAHTNANTNVAFLPQAYTAVASTVDGNETAYANCNNQVDTTPVPTNAAQLTAVQPITFTNPHVVGAAADGSQWIDTTVALPAPTPTPTAPVPYNCPAPNVTLTAQPVPAVPGPLDTCSPPTPPATQIPTQFVALNDGTQVFVTGVDPSLCTTNSTIPEYNLNTTTAGAITLSGTVIPVSGSATLDSQTLIVGATTGVTVSDTGSVHVINLSTNTDTLQISVPFIPDLIAVQPK